MTLNASNQIPWQVERAIELHKACVRLKIAVANGKPIQKTIVRLARSMNRRKFQTDPSRRLALSPATLRRSWDSWNRNGETIASFKLNYRARTPYIPRRLAIRFVGFCSANRLPSVSQAWLEFSTMPRNRRLSRGITCGMICYHFASADFYLMQASLKTIASAQAALTGVKFRAIANITNRLAEKAATPPSCAWK